jgi:hypothetical protein
MGCVSCLIYSVNCGSNSVGTATAVRRQGRRRKGRAVSMIELSAAQLRSAAGATEEWVRAGTGDQFSVRARYSGRAMFGRACVGVVTDDPLNVALFLFYLAGELSIELPDLCEDLASTETDGMGRSAIYYWRNLSVSADYTDDDDPDAGLDDDEDEDELTWTRQ